MPTQPPSPIAANPESAQHLYGGVWENPPLRISSRASPAPGTSPKALPPLGACLQHCLAQDGFKSPQLPEQFWTLQDLLHAIDPELRNGEELRGLGLLEYLLDTSEGALLLRRRAVLKLLWGIYSALEEPSELKRVAGDALNLAIEHGQEPSPEFDPGSEEAKALVLCVTDQPYVVPEALQPQVSAMECTAGLELLCCWWLHGDPELQEAAAAAMCAVQGRDFSPNASLQDQALILAMQPEDTQARVCVPNAEQFVRSSVFPCLCAILAGLTPAPPAAVQGASRALALITAACEGRDTPGFDPEGNPEHAVLLDEMLSLHCFGRPRRLIQSQTLAEHPRHCVVVGVGRVGLPVCHALRALGHHVTAVARFSSSQAAAELQQAGVRCVELDLRHKFCLGELPGQADLLFLLESDREHMGATRPDEVWQLSNNTVGDIVRRYAGQADVIHGSSGGIYRLAGSCEEDPVEPRTEWALAKTAQEQLVDTIAAAAGNTRVVHLRFLNVEGAQDGLIHSTAQSVLRGHSLGEHPELELQLLAVSDAVRYTLLAAELASTEMPCFNVCHPEVWTLAQLAELIAEELGPLRFSNRHLAGDSGRRGCVRFNPSTRASPVATADPTQLIECCGEPQESLLGLIRDICHDVVKTEAGC